MASKDVFSGFTFAAFSKKSIPVVVAVVISPYLIESSIFVPIKTSHLFIGFFNYLKHDVSFWRVYSLLHLVSYQVFVDFLIIYSLRISLVICKK